MSFAIGREPKAGANVLQLKLGKVLHDLLRRHPGGELIEYVVHRDSQPSDAGSSTPLAGLDRDTLSIIHGDLHSKGS
jgi:hypothetical protein